MPHRALSITSTTNFHALGNYMGLTVLGAGYFVNPKIQAVDDLIGPRFAPLVMGMMMMCGIMGFVVAIAAKKRRDPSTALWMEGVLLVLITALLGLLVASVVVKFGVIVAMVTATLLGSWLVGCGGRAVQAFRELHKLNKLRSRPVETVEVPADPDGG